MERYLETVILIVGCLAAACSSAPIDPEERPRLRIDGGPEAFAAVEWNDSLQWDVVARPGESGTPVARFTRERWDSESQNWTLAGEATDARADVFVHQQRGTVPAGSDTLGWRYVAYDGLGLSSEAVEVWVVGGQQRPQVLIDLPGTQANATAGSSLRIRATAEAGATGSDLTRLRIEADTANSDTTWRIWRDQEATGRTAEAILDTLAPATSGRMRWRAVATNTDGQEGQAVRELEVLP